jgi:parallel beta-helix repeat protein
MTMVNSFHSWRINATRRWLAVVGVCVATSLFVIQLLALLPGHKTAVVQAASYTVCPVGPPTCNYATIQNAIDVAQPGDTIKVAAGVYNQVNDHGGSPQVVYLDKSVTLIGGYTTAFVEPPDRIGNPTIVNAQQQGRGIYITGEITPVVEGFRITGGKMPGFGDFFGGGIYVLTATATLRYNHIYDNYANHGGGIYLKQSDASLRHNVILSNTAEYSGGGVYLSDSPATLEGNDISQNSAGSAGGGLYLSWSDAVLENNVISHNSTTKTSNARGAGLYLHWSNARLNNNVIESNSAPGSSSGGGLYLFYSWAQVQNNRIAHNTAGFGSGGGIFLQDSAASLLGNTVISNTAGSGGGAVFVGSSATVHGNSFLYNQATFFSGGGLVLASASNAQLVNNIIALNKAGGSLGGAGIHVSNSSPQFTHTTIAGNVGSDGSGIYVYSASGVTSHITLTNTILAGHTTGVYVAEGSSATLTATLWGSGEWANGTNWGGSGAIEPGTINILGDPAFVNAAEGDFHLQASSAAVDAGVDAGVAIDIDRQARPFGGGFDIGADEYWPALDKAVYLPFVRR